MKLLKKLPETIEVNGVTYHTAQLDQFDFTKLPVMGEDGKVEYKETHVAHYLRKEGYIE